MAREERSRIIKMGWAYTLGILVSFWALVAVLIILRYGGLHIGWGFQLQSPPFVFVLASVFFAFALNLLGCFEISGGFTAYGSPLAYRPGYGGSFFTGILATLVATPCTAPFMGAAVGFALSQSVAVVFGIFTALAIGLALPYLLISYIPTVGRWLPRPGRWMETFKQLMAFLVLAPSSGWPGSWGFRPRQQGWSRCSWRSSVLASRCGSPIGGGERRRSRIGRNRRRPRGSVLFRGHCPCSPGRCNRMGQGRPRLGTVLSSQSGRIPCPGTANVH